VDRSRECGEGAQCITITERLWAWLLAVLGLVRGEAEQKKLELSNGTLLLAKENGSAEIVTPQESNQRGYVNHMFKRP
jgi:hypothetical protein